MLPKKNPTAHWLRLANGLGNHTPTVTSTPPCNLHAPAADTRTPKVPRPGMVPRWGHIVLRLRKRAQEKFVANPWTLQQKGPDHLDEVWAFLRLKLAEGVGFEPTIELPL